MRTEYWIVIGILCYAAFMVFHGFSNFKVQFTRDYTGYVSDGRR